MQTFLSRRVIKQEDTQKDNEESESVITLEAPEEILLETQESTEEVENMVETEELEVTNETEEITLAELDDRSSENSLCIQEVIVKPDMDAENLSLDISNTEFEAQGEYVTLENAQGSESCNSVAAFVASSEVNVRLRQRIAMKKMRSLDNSSTKPLTPELLKRKRGYFYHFTVNEKG